MPVNIQAILQMMAFSISIGQPPAELHVNQKTLDEIITALVSIAGAPKKPSLRKRFKRWLNDTPPDPWSINGIPFVVNPIITDGAVMVRPLHLMGACNWMEEVAKAGWERFQALQKSGMAVREHFPVPELEAAADETMKATAGKSVTDILIDATTNCDDVRTVIVITVKGSNGQVALRANTDKYAIHGILNAVWNKMNEGSD